MALNFLNNGTFAGTLQVTKTGSGTDNTIITQDSARKIFIGRDSIKCTDLSDNAAMLYIQQNGGHATFGNEVHIPSYIYHVGDTDTLFGFRAQDIFVINTGGGRRLTVTNTEATFENNLIVDGNVGIGTTTPPVKFVVNNGVARTSTAKTYSTFVHTNDTDDFRIGLATAIKGGAATADRYISIEGASYQVSTDTFTNEDIDLVLNPVAGNVGIGTTSPSEKLEVDGNVQIGSTTDAKLYMVSTGGNGNNERFFIEGYADGATYGGGFKLSTRNDSNIFNTAVTVNRNGNVGIGTISPDSRLDVTGGSITINTNSTEFMSFKYGAAGSETSRGTITTDGVDLKINATADLLLLPTTNVGIGTTTPLEKLVISDSDESLKDVLGVYNTVTTTSALNKGAAIRIGLDAGGAYSTKIATIYEDENPSFLQPALAFFTMNNTYLKGSEVERMRISSAGAIKFNAYGAGTLVTDASGNITASSGGGAGGPYLPLSAGSSFPLTGGLTGTTATFSGAVGIGTTGIYSTDRDLNLSGKGISIKNNITGSNNNWSYIYNTATASSSNLVFATGNSLTALTLENSGDAIFTGDVGIGNTNPAQKLHISDGGIRVEKLATGLGGFVSVGNATESAGNYSAYFFGNTGLDNDYFKGGIAYETLASTNGRGDMHFLQNSNPNSSNANIADSVMTILNGGNVGIGTTSPNEKLQIHKSDRPYIQLSSDSTGDASSDGSFIGFNSSAGALEIRNKENQPIRFLTNDSVRATISNTGNVGIGATNPGDKLSIEDSGSVRMSIYSTDTGSQSVPKTFIDLYGENTAAQKRKQASIASAPGHDASNAGELQFFTNDSSQVSQQRMTIRADGTVGIGTTNPTSTLHVDGSSGSTAEFRGATQSTVNFKAGSASNYLVGTTTGDFSFRPNGSTSTTMLANGNVGIGTTSPNNILELSKTVSSDIGPVLQLTNSQYTNADNSGSSIQFRGYTLWGPGSSNPRYSEINAINGAGSVPKRIEFKFYADTVVKTPLSVLQTGNVGIGTTSPTGDLSVGSTTTSSGDIHLRTTKTTVTLTPSNTAAGGFDIDTGFVSGGQGPMTISIGGGEKMRIANNGNVGINNTNPTGKLDVFRTATSFAVNRADTLSRAGLIIKSSGNFDSKISFSSGASSVQYIQATNNSATVGRDININPYGGNVITAGTMTATNFILSSDERLKENIKEVCDNRIKADWKTFELKTERGQKRYGVIAQELEKTNPEFVREDSQGFKSVAYIDLLIAKIAELEARLEKLEK